MEYQADKFKRLRSARAQEESPSEYRHQLDAAIAETLARLAAQKANDGLNTLYPPDDASSGDSSLDDLHQFFRHLEIMH